MIDSPLFHKTGGMILTWSVNAAQPTAIVFTSKGTFSTPLSDVPEALREPISLGRYQARYSVGYVLIWLRAYPSRRVTGRQNLGKECIFLMRYGLLG
jgi:hypothetical protein